MSQNHCNLIYHLVFSTKERRQVLTPEFRQDVHRYLAWGGIGPISCLSNAWPPGGSRPQPRQALSAHPHPKKCNARAQYVEVIGGEAPIGHSLLDRIQRPAGNALADSTGSQTGYAVQTLPNNLRLVNAQGKPSIAKKVRRRTTRQYVEFIK